MTLRQFSAYLGGTLAQIPADLLLAGVALVFLCFIVILRTDLRNENSIRSKLCFAVSSYLAVKALSVMFAAKRFKYGIGKKANMKILDVANRGNATLNARRIDDHQDVMTPD